MYRCIAFNSLSDIYLSLLRSRKRKKKCIKTRLGNHQKNKCLFLFKILLIPFSYLCVKMIFILILLHVAAVTCTKSLCLDQTDPLSINSRQWIECPFVSHQNEKRSSQSAPFTVTFHCFDLAPDDCIKAERAFKKAGDMLSSYIVFNEPVRVNATLVSFCKQLTQCDDNSTLGGSLPLRSMPLMNRDGVVRLHPQALVKQLQLRHHPAYAPFDIQSLFNADAPFWFDASALLSTSTDSHSCCIGRRCTHRKASS